MAEITGINSLSQDLYALMNQCVGTENYYKNHFLSFQYTDGVKCFCEKAHAYWLLVLVESVIKNAPDKFEDLVSITLFVDEDQTAVILFKDSENTFYRQKIQYTDCPKGEWNFFLQNNIFFYVREY